MKYAICPRIGVASIVALMLFSIILSGLGSSIDLIQDEITYDVYFGTSNPPPKVVSNQTGTDYDPPGLLEYNTTYFWQIVAWDEQGSAVGPIWHFTTERMNQPPVAVVNGPSVADKKVAVGFDGSDSYDPDGSVVNWSWDFGDGLYGFGETVDHSYLQSGSYQVVLEVKDDDGATGEDAFSIEILNHAPFADIVGPSSGLVGEPLTFDGSGSSDPDGDSLTFDWDLDDGSTSEAVIVEHVYNHAGTFIVTLMVTDDDLNNPMADTDTLVVEISEPNSPPIADAGPDQTVNIFDVVTFDGSNSVDTDGSIVNWTWDFGTGDYGYGEIVTYMYHADGEYFVTLTVTDDDGATDDDTCTITVLGARNMEGISEELKVPEEITSINAPIAPSVNVKWPNPPSNPYPEDGATEIPLDVVLNWTGGSTDLEVAVSGGIGVTISITNVGESLVDNLSCSFAITGGFFRLINVSVDEIVTLSVNESTQFSSDVFTGFGPIKIAVSFDEYATLERTGFHFLIFTKIY